MNKLFFLIVVTVFSVSRLLAQGPPSEDNRWVLVESLSDEFNDTILDSTKWDALEPEKGIGYDWGGGAHFRPNNVSVDGNYLQLKVEKRNDRNGYFSGGIQSVENNYTYGYFEIRAKLPGFYKDGKPNGQGFWPAFWTYYQVQDSTGCVLIHDEIDILEPAGHQYADGRSNVAGWHDKVPGSCKTEKVSGDVWYTNDEPLFEAFHKYAVMWLPDRIIFYFDDKPFYAAYDNPKMKMRPQFVVIDQQIDGNNLPFPYLDPEVPLPQCITVDYFRYYRLSPSSLHKKIEETK